jgi:hypothetical protein
MSNLKYLHKVLTQSLKDGVAETHEELIVDGPKGITIKLYKKKDDVVEKIMIMGKDDKFTLKTQKGDAKDSKDLTRSELLAELSKNKSLKFAAEFAKTQKGGQLLGGRKTSKKASKKASKKVAKPTSKKVSKKSSKKVEKK